MQCLKCRFFHEGCCFEDINVPVLIKLDKMNYNCKCFMEQRKEIEINKFTKIKRLLRYLWR